MKEVRGLYWALEGKWDLRRPKRSGGYFSRFQLSVAT